MIHSLPALAPDDLASLIRKYTEILRLRRSNDPDPRRAMALLAEEFPGALRETDELPIADLEQRLAALRTAALDPGSVLPWMALVARFHALTRGALVAKRWLAGRKRVDVAVARAFRHGSGLSPAALEWGDQLHRLAAPPRGRVTELVFERMAAELGVTPDAARRAVFPGASRRRG